jgi:hypothetical protein
MNRREFLAISSGVTYAEFPFLPRGALKSIQVSQPKTDRHPVLVRAGFTRRANGAENPQPLSRPLFAPLIPKEGSLLL